MNENETRMIATIYPDRVELHTNGKFIGWIDGQPYKVAPRGLDDGRLIIHVKLDGRYSGIAIVHAIQKGDQ